MDETNTDVSRRMSEKMGKEMRMTLHSNKLILLEHAANLWEKRSQKSGRLGDFCVQQSRSKRGGVGMRAGSPLTAVLISFRYPGLPKVFPSLALLILDTLAAALFYTCAIEKLDSAGVPVSSVRDD